MLKPAILLLEFLSGALGLYLAKMPHICFVWHIKALAWIFYILDKRRYNDAYANLEFVYGQTLSYEEKHAIIRRCYENFAFVLLESIRVVYLNPQTYTKRFEFVDEYHITESINKDGGAVLVSAHFGYWEAMATILPPRYRMCQMASLGRLTQFESINHMIIKRRENNGVRMIDKKGAFKHLIKMYAQKNALVGILVDQNISLHEGVEVEFFGKRATHTTIASVLSRRFGVNIVPVFINPNKDYSRYKVRFYEPIRANNSHNMSQDILEATQAQAHITQRVIESSPSSWFWFHKRFKIFYPDMYQKKYP